LKTWEIKINDKNYRVVLEKDTLNIFLNGVLREEKPEFVESGTETHFAEDGHKFALSARSGDQNDPIIYTLSVNGAVHEIQ
jgi:Fas apoptotic inhibitory molecule (FAIM1)